MKITFKDLLAEGLKGLTILGDPDTMRTIGSMPNINPDKLHLWENSIVGSCLSSAIDAVTEPPLCVYRLEDDGETWTIVPGHPAAEIVNKPNPYYDGDNLLQAGILSLMCDGNDYVLKVRNGFGTVRELWYEPHFCITPWWDTQKSTFIDYYERAVRSGIEKWAPRDVIHLRWGIDPLNTRRGLAPLKAALRRLNADNQIDQYTHSMIANLGMVGLFVSPSGDGEIGDEEASALESALDRKFRGEGRGKTFVSSGAIDVTVPGHSPRDMAIDDMGRVGEERVSGILNTPAIIAGLGAGLARSTFANMEEAQKYYSYRFLVPRWKKKARVLTDQLLHVEIGQFFGGDLKEAKRHRYGFDLRNVKALQEDADALHARAREDFAKGLISRAAGKRMIGEKFDASEEEIYATSPAANMEGAKAKVYADLKSRASARRQFAEQFGTEWDED